MKRNLPMLALGAELRGAGLDLFGLPNAKRIMHFCAVGYVPPGGHLCRIQA
jgi:hypothetical protein